MLKRQRRIGRSSLNNSAIKEAADSLVSGLVPEQEEQGAQAEAADVDGQEPLLRRLAQDARVPAESESRRPRRRGWTTARFPVFWPGQVRIRLRRPGGLSSRVLRRTSTPASTWTTLCRYGKSRWISCHHRWFNIFYSKVKINSSLAFKIKKKCKIRIDRETSKISKVSYYVNILSILCVF